MKGSFKLNTIPKTLDMQWYTSVHKMIFFKGREIYRRLQDRLDSRHKHNMLIINGVMNAKVGDENKGYKRIRGKHWLGKHNESGECVCDLSCIHDLVITGTLLSVKSIHKVT